MFCEPEQPRKDGQKVLLLSDAPTDTDLVENRLHSDHAGHLLKHEIILAKDFDISSCYYGSILSQPLPYGGLTSCTVTKTEMKKLGHELLGNPINKRYLLPAYRQDVAAALAAIQKLAPNLIIALGSLPLWAITGESRITMFRGNFMETAYGMAIATHAPLSVHKEYNLRPFVWADLAKAEKYLNKTLPPNVARRAYINPTWAELQAVYTHFLANPTALLGVDIETAPSIGQITCIGFATESLGICLPFWNKANGKPFNPTPEAELRMWRWAEKFANLPNPKVMQNGLYDMQYLLDAPIPIRCRNVTDDTAILQHALQPEMLKSLGTLSSFYLNEPSWKQMRESDKESKKDD
jgi:hypothetical protein